MEWGKCVMRVPKELDQTFNLSMIPVVMVEMEPMLVGLKKSVILLGLKLRKSVFRFRMT